MTKESLFEIMKLAHDFVNRINTSVPQNSCRNNLSLLFVNRTAILSAVQLSLPGNNAHKIFTHQSEIFNLYPCLIINFN